MVIASQYVRGVKVYPPLVRGVSGAAQIYLTGEVANPMLTSVYVTSVPAGAVKTATVTSVYSTSVA